MDWSTTFELGNNNTDFCGIQFNDKNLKLTFKIAL